MEEKWDYSGEIKYSPAFVRMTQEIHGASAAIWEGFIAVQARRESLSRYTGFVNY